MPQLARRLSPFTGAGVLMRLPGKMAPWGRWELDEDGRVVLSFRCVCNPGEVHSQYLTLNENGSMVEMRCPRCRLQIVRIQVQREIAAEGGAPGTGKG